MLPPPYLQRHGLFHQHDGYILPHGINHPAGGTDKAQRLSGMRLRAKLAVTTRTGQYPQQFFSLHHHDFLVHNMREAHHSRIPPALQARRRLPFAAKTGEMPEKDTAMRYIDLHTHSQASDGTDSPAELVKNAAAAGLAAVALTDHDTLSGLDEAEDAARALDIEFIRGCELSTRTEYGEMHILGLWLPREADALEHRLADVRRKRGQRNARILEKLAALDIHISMEELLHEARGESVGRPHIAALLVKKGVVPDMSAAFRDYLGSGGRAYLPRDVLDPEEAVRLMAGLGATVCLAHPCLQPLPRDWLEAFILRLRDCGLSAIEAYHSEHADADTRTCIDLARRFNLALSGGSDYHGTNKPRIRLGSGYGSLRVPLAILDDLKARRREHGLPC